MNMRGEGGWHSVGDGSNRGSNGAGILVLVKTFELEAVAEDRYFEMTGYSII